MVIEKVSTVPEEENLTGDISGELSNLEGDVINMNQPKKDISHKAIDTKYHNPEMDQFRSQQFFDNSENSTNNEGEMSEKDKEALITELKLSLPSIKDRADEIFEKYLTVLIYIKNVKSELNDDIKDLAEEKLTKDIDFTNEVIKKYKKLEGEEKPDFFAFFCACLGYEKIEDKPNNGCLTIVDFSNTTDGHSNNKKKKTGSNLTKNGTLFLINMNTNEITLKTDRSPQGRGVIDNAKDKRDKEYDLGFSNRSDSLKSSLGFTQVKEPNIYTGGSTGYYVILKGLEPEFNGNVTKRSMYAHGGTYSEGCTVVPLEYRELFLNTLVGRAPNEPVKKGEINPGNSRGVVFTYSSKAVNYLKNSEMLA